MQNLKHILKYALLLTAILALLEWLTYSARGQAVWGNAVLNTYSVAAVAEAPTACSTYDTTNSWDDFIEGFETATTGYESNVWTKIGTTANINEVYDSSALTDFRPPGVCSQSLYVDIPTDGTETWLRGNLGYVIDVDTVQTDFVCSFYVVTGPGTNEALGLVGVGQFNTGASWVANIFLQNTAGQLNVKCSFNATTINISAGQWYTAIISMDTARAATGSTFSLFSGGSHVGTTLTGQRGASDIGYLYVGGFTSVDAGDNATIVYDLIGINTP